MGEVLVTTDGSCNASFKTSVSVADAPAGRFITATATDPEGNTSEFSACQEVVGYRLDADAPHRGPDSRRSWRAGRVRVPRRDDAAGNGRGSQRRGGHLGRSRRPLPGAGFIQGGRGVFPDIRPGGAISRARSLPGGTRPSTTARPARARARRDARRAMIGT